MRKIALIVGVGAAVSAAHAQQYVMGVDSTTDAVHLFDATTGALFQQSFIDLSVLGAATPIEALQVGNQIWVSDQLEDVIYRFGLNGSHLGTIGNAGLDNIKGMAVVGNQVWVTNAGSNNGAPDDSIVFIDASTGVIGGSAATNGSLFDLINYNGMVLGSNITTDDLELYDTSGNFASIFHASDGVSGIDFPEQLYAMASGNVLAAGFSTPAGVYEYDAFGNELGIVAGSGESSRGVLELLGGSIMWTSGDGFFVGTDQVFGGVSGRYLSVLTIPAPGALGLLGVGGFMAARRRR